jgi:hypothetical protein
VKATEVLVYVDLEGEPVPVGRLWARMRNRRDSATFEYDQGWLERPDRFALEPALQPGGPFLAADDAKPIPPLVELPRLLSAAEHVVGDSDSDEDLRLLLAPGSSLGGARPAYDLNPVPVDIKPRVLATAIDLDDGMASLDLAMSVAGYLDLEDAEARQIARAVGQTVSGWRDAAKRIGLASVQIDRMASAFEHDDLSAAIDL